MDQQERTEVPDRTREADLVQVADQLSVSPQVSGVLQWVLPDDQDHAAAAVADLLGAILILAEMKVRAMKERGEI